MCNCKPGILHIVFKVAWVITILAAVNMGLAAADLFDVFNLNFFTMNPMAKTYTMYAIGVAGVLSAVALGMHLMSCMSGNCKGCSTR